MGDDSMTVTRVESVGPQRDRMVVIPRRELDALIEAAARWLHRETQYGVPPDQRQRNTDAAKLRDRVSHAIERNRAMLRIFGG